MKSINSRLLELIELKTQGNATAFAREIGEKQQNFERLLKPDKRNGKYPLVLEKTQQAILKRFPDINEVWLLTGKEPMLFSDKKTNGDDLLPLGDLKVTLKDYVDLLKEKERKAEQHAELLARIIEANLLNPADDEARRLREKYPEDRP